MRTAGGSGGGRYFRPSKEPPEEEQVTLQFTVLMDTKLVTLIICPGRSCCFKPIIDRNAHAKIASSSRRPSNIYIFYLSTRIPGPLTNTYSIRKPIPSLSSNGPKKRRRCGRSFDGQDHLGPSSNLTISYPWVYVYLLGFALTLQLY